MAFVEEMIYGRVKLEHCYAQLPPSVLDVLNCFFLGINIALEFSGEKKYVRKYTAYEELF